MYRLTSAFISAKTNLYEFTKAETLNSKDQCYDIGETGASCYGGKLLQGHFMQNCHIDGEIADSSSIIIHQRNH